MVAVSNASGMTNRGLQDAFVKIVLFYTKEAIRVYFDVL